MNIMSMSCSACGAPIKVPDELDELTCSHCGTSLVVQRGEGYTALKVAEQIGKALQDSAQQTHADITEGTQITQIELKRLQKIQELSVAHMQLGNLQAQIRSLSSSKPNRKTRKQLNELRTAESSALQQINTLQATLNPNPVVNANINQNIQNIPAPAPKHKEPFSRSPIKMGCATFFLVYSLIGMLVMAVTTSTTSTEGLSIAMFIGAISGIYIGYRVNKKNGERGKQAVGTANIESEQPVSIPR